MTGYTNFECEPNIYIDVNYATDSGNGVELENISDLKSKWKELWPPVLAFLKNMRKKYDFSTDFTASDLRVSLLGFDKPIGPDTSWEASFTFEEEGFGHWGIAFQGWTIDPENSQPYF
jgi:hypothetical protein